ncbi:bifunctional non-homologous end joining protein LigD [Paenibacillus sp. 1_12]|uniref:ATP-dependent DNA ligase n=1 Tax=Paenibacillus sp. 1_12 TaxID=1566278 RepID=UPI0008EF530C|nr:RNA ligase family protein [Paenibacillus sp. 1_12]SFK71102.1 bifunctional non-homologous end joining protein LigD [Paenibacillus sp. 1_12]
MIITPVVPFEPISNDEIPKGEPWIAQIKWDGVRMLTYFNGLQVKLYNRKLNERTLQYPELLTISAYCNAQSVILDGEIIAFDHSKPSFHEIMKRDQLRKASRIDSIQAQVPIVYMIFDVLFLNGEWVTGKTLQERQQILSSIIVQNDHVQLVQNFTDTQELFKVAKAHDLEGIVCKDLSSAYTLDGKDQRWQKKKNYKDVIAVVGGVTLRSGVVNSLLLGLFNEQKLVYIGHAGAGRLSNKEWLQFTKLIQSLIQTERPFSNEPERSHEAVWIKPVITVKIQFMEWTHHLILRQPSIQTFVEAKPEECTFESE